jgi:hypothetical protein
MYNTRVVEIVDHDRMEEMCNEGDLRTMQSDVISTCRSPSSRADELTCHLDNQEEEVIGSIN